jgi:hypothetical protein
VVVKPDNADVDERHRIGEIGWPLFQEFFDQLPRNGGRAVNLENKQGDDDGEDTIREHFYAGGFNEVAISGIGAVHFG